MSASPLFPDDITDGPSPPQSDNSEYGNFSDFAGECPDPILRIGDDGRVLYSNPAGIPLLDVWDTSVGDWMPEHALNALRVKTGEKQQDGSASPLEVEVQCGDRCFAFRIVRVPGKSFVTLYGHDVTAQKEAEREVLRVQDQWERTFDSVPDLIALIDSKHQIIRANRAMAERLGATPEQCVGKFCYESVHDTLCPPSFCPHALTIADGHEHSTEVHEERLGGYFIVSCTPVFDEGGKFFASVHVARDITERKRWENQLQRTADDLARSNKDLQQFAYVASHDLQEPLRSIGGFLRILEKQYGTSLDDTAREYINYAVSGAERMQSLIQDLLSFSRVTSDQKPLQATSMEAVLQEVLESLHQSIQDNSAQISHDSLPMVMADPAQMRQLLQNLLSNAIKFQKPGEIPRVHLGVELRDNVWVFQVKDNGIGIDPQYHEKIFAIFQRLHSREEYAGTGIGLAVCKRIIERCGGEIWLDSRLGEGTSFFFSMPKI